MAHQLKRLAGDAINTWQVMPKSQALRWYGAVLRHAPTILRERKFYSADRDMRGTLRFFLLGRDFTVDVDAMSTTAGNSYAFLREFFVRQIYFREFKQLNFDTCLDLGCNVGEVSGFLRQLAGPQGRVVGIDPSPTRTMRSAPGSPLSPESRFIKASSAESRCVTMQPPCTPCATPMASTSTWQSPSKN
jgi:hypothetical protein